MIPSPVAKQARRRLPGAEKTSVVAGDNELVQQTVVHVSGRFVMRLAFAIPCMESMYTHSREPCHRIFDQGRHINRICMEVSKNVRCTCVLDCEKIVSILLVGSGLSVSGKLP